MFSLSDEEKRKCLDFAGRSLESLEKDVKSIRDWMNVQHHFPKFDISDEVVLQFLIRNKFKVDSAKSVIENYFVVRTAVPDFFLNINPTLPERRSMAKTNLLVVLPSLTNDFSAVFWVKVLKPNAFNCLFLQQESLNVVELQLRKSFFLSEVLVLDVNNIFAEDYVKISTSFLRKGVLIYQKAYKIRLKAIYVINSKKHFNVFLTLVKPFLKAKIFERIRLDPGTDCLQTFLSKSQIPKDYGGEGPSLETINEMINAKYFEEKDLFDQLDTLQINEELRPERLNNDEILGYYGNFKKLDVD